MANRNWMSGEESECLWIDNHPEYYRDIDHQELVKGNIRKRYKEQREERERLICSMVGEVK